MPIPKFPADDSRQNYEPPERPESDAFEDDDSTVERISIDDQLDLEMDDDEDVLTPVEDTSPPVSVRKEPVVDDEDLDLFGGDSSDIEDSADELDEAVAEKPKERKVSKKIIGGNSEDQSVEIDSKAKKIRPFGSQKRTLRVSHLDPRKDLRTSKIRVQIIVLIMLVLVVMFGGYNALFPKKPPTPDEIAAIALQVTGYTNYPVDEGGGFAKDFIEAYLTISPEDPVSQKVLNYYYTGNMNAASSGSNSYQTNRSVSSNYKQTILYGPTIYTAKGLTDNSARYTVAALVQKQALDSQGKVTNAVTDGSNAEWQFFNVNVYYDEGSNSFAITKDSPTLIPATEVTAQKDIPQSLPLGSGSRDGDVEEKISSLVNGFIEGYAKTSPTDYSPIEQYIISKPPAELTRGLNSQYTLSDSNSSISYEAYPVEDSNEVKVRVIVEWQSVAGTSSDTNTPATVTYTSQYVMTLEAQSDGRYLISKFAPEYYVEDVEGE